ncbi:uncharacterized protein BYT42DRAFT_505762, partial [Radiomyces spectabilis]|uniref:uncharacterized protein n=1 Tax=Radiomyces spectabilis TaxID=64574 RepID=UPI002220C723
RGQRHRDSSEYTIVKKVGHGGHDAIHKRFACPSCLEHFETINEYEVHIHTHISTLPTESEQTGDPSPSNRKRQRTNSVTIACRHKNTVISFSSSSYLNPQNTPKFPKYDE